MRGEISVGDTTRFLSISMKFETEKKCKQNNNINRKQRRTYHNLCLTTIYFPHSGYKETELESFHVDLSSFLSNILVGKNTTHIIGADTNSSFGTRESLCESASYPDKHESHLDIDPILQLLGPCGNPRRSKTGEEVLNLMREHQLRAASTFFDNNRKYNTWLGIPNAITKKRYAYQLDHIFIPKHLLCHTTNIKRKFDGAHSHHAALCIDFYFLTSPLLKKKKDPQSNPKPTMKLNNTILRGKELSNFQKKVNEFFDEL
jgi:hypothetical protein